jgi:hypothetical protein
MKTNRSALVRAKINSKSLAAEALFIKREIDRSIDRILANNLHNHRILKVRPEARLTNLAIGYLKGRARKSVEVSDREVDFKRLAKKINIFIDEYFNKVSEEDLRNWYNQ